MAGGGWAGPGWGGVVWCGVASIMHLDVQKRKSLRDLSLGNCTYHRDYI